MERVFTNLLETLGVKRADDLLLKCRSDLAGKATDIKTIKENCSVCARPNIMAWEYIQDGKPNSWRYSPVCSFCARGVETVQVTKEMNNIRKQAVLNKWYYIQENDSCGFKNYEPTNKATDKALKEAKAYAREILKGNLTLNMLLMGSTGTGKSHLAKTVAKTAKEKGLNVAYIEATELFNLIKATFGHERHNEMFYNEFKAFDLVVIDDVGLETKKRDEVSWSVSEWTKLINAREGKATVLTTNFDDSALAEVIGQRAFSRMYMNTKFIDLFTDDYRRKMRL
jgi:DNA replication protein DnaC